jgi:hypothetical protein
MRSGACLDPDQTRSKLLEERQQALPQNGRSGSVNTVYLTDFAMAKSMTRTSAMALFLHPKRSRETSTASLWDIRAIRRSPKAHIVSDKPGRIAPGAEIAVGL